MSNGENNEALIWKLKKTNKNIQRLKAQAPFIKDAIRYAESMKALKGILHAEQYIKIINDVIDS